MGTITIRVPDALHAALRREAHERCTSLNKLCIAKVRQELGPLAVNRDNQLLAAAVTPGAAPCAVAWSGGGSMAKLGEPSDTGDVVGDTPHPCTVPGVVCKWREVHIPGQGAYRYVCKAPGGTPCPAAGGTPDTQVQGGQGGSDTPVGSPDTPDTQVQGGQGGPGGPESYVTSSDTPRHPVTTEQGGVTSTNPGMVAKGAAAQGRGPCKGCRTGWLDGSCRICPGPGYMLNPPPDGDLGDPVPPMPALPACGLPDAPCGWRQGGGLCHLPGDGPCPQAAAYHTNGKRHRPTP